MNDLIKALQILSKYCPEDVYAPTHCEHDVLYVTCVEYDKVSPEDVAALKELGFRKGEFGFESFRFGSS